MAGIVLVDKYISLSPDLAYMPQYRLVKSAVAGLPQTLSSSVGVLCTWESFGQRRGFSCNRMLKRGRFVQYFLNK
jgi:hypothetical protein